MAEHDPQHDVPIEMEPMEVEEAPRRAASAQFEVEAEVGSEVGIREAMDPANQSLADALRLSYRVLQAVILVLIVMFFVSGVHIVKQGQGGVMTRFGEIVRTDGREALGVGRKWNFWPYPAGDFVTFPVENRQVGLGSAFWPSIPEGQTLQQAIANARTTSGLRPGRDGSALTRDADLAHLQVTADYRIDDPVGFVKRFKVDEADRIVRLCLERSVVGVMAETSLQELVDLPEDVRSRIMADAQSQLDELGSGIELVAVQIPDAKPPFAVVQSFDELQEAREQVRERVAMSQTQAQELLEGKTGNYRELRTLIRAHQKAVDAGDRALAAERLAAVKAELAGEATTGEIDEIVTRAQAYESDIQLTLGNDVGIYESLLPAYRKHPELVVKRLWLETYAQVLSREDIEVFYVPAGVQKLGMKISSSEDIQQLRQKGKLERLEHVSRMEALEEIRDRLKETAEMFADKPTQQGRTGLTVDEEGKVRPR